ncbi:MAG: hypothetical protein OMM_06665 [Candidatus Magnetoglobus multicellularis str. Araruama]|uniref:Uncharacterized protein n=1 Tax=Candidatus Magnetoglobus multicellularis str. Araruama TaxID=890399 RepID=A0A1V1PGT2_9BACT|nr:MAG: hypothetical protein OMM_06665 [Candidatus Magnetoglobus multicellularis str. Araruama]
MHPQDRKLTFTPVQVTNSGCVKASIGKTKKLRLWLYAHNGVTKLALDLINQHGILWSDKNDLNALLNAIGLRKLSEITLCFKK